jgi:hypothetical protein
VQALVVALELAHAGAQLVDQGLLVADSGAVAAQGHPAADAAGQAEQVGG